MVVMTKNHSQGLSFAVVLVAFGWLQMKEKKRNERERRKSIYIKGNGIITRLPSYKESCVSFKKMGCVSFNPHSRLAIA